MNPLVEEIRNYYYGQIRRASRSDFGFCVGGALCHYMDTYLDDEDWYNLSHGQQKFPYTDDLVRALQNINKNWGRGHIDEWLLTYYADSMQNYNDMGEFDKAWDIASELFDSMQFAKPIIKFCGECGESRPDDARVQGGMRCGVCAYG